jgi:DNA-binding CsgD family transcriptional regulator
MHRAEIVEIRSALRELLAQRTGTRSDVWRQSVLRSLRILTGSDKAILVVRTAAGPAAYGEVVSRDLLSAYVNRFAVLDRSRVAVTEHGLEVWSLSQLWPSGELERSKYYQSFATPNRLHDTVGVTLQFVSPEAQVCLVFHKTARGLPSVTEHRRELLSLLLEPIRVGFGLDLGTLDPVPQMSSLIDVAGQALALYGIDGRELTQNPVLRRILAQDQERDSLLEQIRAVARSVLNCLASGGEPRGRTHWQPDGTRREVATSQAAYRLRGNLVGRNALGHGTAILVSLDRVAFQVPAPDSLRARYGLTLRELQVASLLMHRLTNAEIARMLNISPHTARHHTESVLGKFGVRSREALRCAITEIPPG